MDRSLTRSAKGSVTRIPSETNHAAEAQRDANPWTLTTRSSCKRASGEELGDLIFFQGHASPGIYSRTYIEHRLEERHMVNFRRELAKGGGLSIYPHPWLMPNLWQFPTVSMGLAGITSIYQARYNEYLRDRDLSDTTGRKVWAFCGDGELDEPESLDAITLAARERLDNLIWVINCNLQRLDDPVRGNGSVIQALEAAFRGAGWNVIKNIWESESGVLFDGRLKSGYPCGLFTMHFAPSTQEKSRPNAPDTAEGWPDWHRSCKAKARRMPSAPGAAPLRSALNTAAEARRAAKTACGLTT